MQDPTCAHCGTRMTDRSSVAESDGKTYCCTNCARMTDEAVHVMASGMCAHCATQITDQTTVAERDGMIFCCNNCANAMGRGDEATAPTY